MQLAADSGEMPIWEGKESGGPSTIRRQVDLLIIKPRNLSYYALKFLDNGLYTTVPDMLLLYGPCFGVRSTNIPIRFTLHR